MTTPTPPPDASDAPPPPRPWPPGTILVHAPSRYVGVVRYWTTPKGGEVLRLDCCDGSFLFAVEDVEAIAEELRPPMAREEAEREVQLFVSAQPFAGPNRRLLAEMALDGSPEQQIAALATYADWRNAGPSDHGHRDEDYRAAYDGVRSGLARHFSEWSQALDMGEGFIDHLDQRAMAVMAGEEMANDERKRLEDALLDHFLALRAGGTPAVEVQAPPVPPPATATLAPESEEVWEATLRVQGAVHVLDPADLASGERPEISIAVDDGEWTVRLEYYPFPFELVHVVLVPKGSSILLRHSAAGWDVRVDGQALTLTPVGEAVVESGRIAIVSAAPDTARRSMRYTAAWAAAWPWGAYFSTGGDGTVPVLVGHTPDGVLQAVVLANCACEEEDEHPWGTLDRLAIRRVQLTVNAMIVLCLGGYLLAWRWISLLPVGDPIDRYLRFLPTALLLWHYTAWSASRRKPWLRPSARRTQAIALALFSPALIVPLGHLLLVHPALKWWSWPLMLLSLAALASEAWRLVRGDGAAYNQPLTADALRSFPRDED